MEIRLINLDRSVDRLKRFRNHNMTHNNINRVSAIDGTKIDRLELIEGELLDPSLIYTDGAIGCALSHIIQWNYAVENEKPITIIEDNAILSKNFSEETERLIGTLNDDWDIVFWAYNMDSYISLQMPGGRSCHVNCSVIERSDEQRGCELQKASFSTRSDRACGMAVFPVSAEFPPD